MKKLPIGISNLKEIAENNYSYADKTKYIKQLADNGKYYFLSRPRRFGKSLFADTLREAFLGNKDLFKGLYLEKNWDWSQRYPVIFLSFGGGVIKSRKELDEKVEEIINEYFKVYGIKPENNSLSGKFRELILRTEEKFSKRVVIIVDEYDKPILDNITDKDKALDVREGLKNIYSVIKDSDAFVQFAFLTGVSKFSKVSLFSGLNNLQDITLDKRYSDICGYTEQELETVFQERLEGLNREGIKKWYNGYNFSGTSVYNPFDILLFLDTKEFNNFWFETATPAFLIEILKEKKYLIPNLEKLYATEALLGSFDIDFIELETILFQTGYLTIKDSYYLGSRKMYELSFPNHEVKMSLTEFILGYFISSPKIQIDSGMKLYRLIEANKIDELKELFYAFFASIPHDWYRKNELSGYEGYYASIFYCYFTSIGLDVRAEDTSNQGRLDMSVRFEDRVYIFEFKVIRLSQNKQSALGQIKEKKYFEKFISDCKEIYLVGVEFDSENRSITCFEWEKV
ncbi:PD-(D/E)XK nuclease superfamily protein [Desulfobotulus alkaliphilus]|uniref:PD-(D/E)XK nuclease superfamily protein n=1 Tax=Desulfobotulus alkaliphilus TaxID=622671 RepID=A0A562RCZ9_9BACT|nr:ATP-binding protein [Desulfobotulus alkaliphilus]TWI66925.1 PD-(D/E)XK nuclease superfamily protein [Desulfobotulus alkaliphilus]